MKPRDSFGVVVRVIGLLCFLTGLFWACFKTLWLLETMFNFGDRSLFPYTYRGASIFGYIYAATFIIIGYLLMRMANWLANFLYPGEDK